MPAYLVLSDLILHVLNPRIVVYKYKYCSIDTSVIITWDQVCENQPCPHKLQLVGYSSISSVLKEIMSEALQDSPKISAHVV